MSGFTELRKIFVSENNEFLAYLPVDIFLY